MAIGTYSTGTVSVSGGDTVVVGSGTIWTGVNARSGDDIVIAGHTVVVKDVTDATSIVIDSWPYADVTAGSSYQIIQRSPLRFAGGQAMADVSTLVAALNTTGFYHFVGPSETAPDPSLGEDGQYARQPSTGKEWVKSSGIWSYLGIYGNLTISTEEWSPSTTYSTRIVVPRAGKLWASLQSGNTNHAPETSPTWWSLFLAGGDAYDILMFDTDRPASGELVLRHQFTKTVTFYAGLTESRASAETAATGAAAYTFKKNGTSFGTCTFGAGQTSATFAASADATFAIGDILTVYAPATRDPTLASVSITLSGYRT